MNNLALEDVAKQIFVQCLNDSEILELFKEKLGCNECRREYAKPHQDDGEVFLTTEMMDKINQMFERQNQMLEQQQKISESVSQNDYKKMEQALNDYLEQAQAEEKHYLAENNKLKKIIDKQEQKIKSLQDKYSTSEEIIGVWDDLNKLNTENRQYINSLAGGDNLLSIISLGRDEGKIGQLWLFLRDIAIKDDSSQYEISILNRYFEFCINVYNLTKDNEEEKYICYEASIGDEFEGDEMIKTVDSRQIGVIKEVVVKGYIYKDQIKYKTIVKVS